MELGSITILLFIVILKYSSTLPYVDFNCLSDQECAQV